MQRVFRSSLVSLLTIAGLAACGDKVNVTPPPTPVVDNTVHSVVVTPSPVSIAVGQSITLAAAVDAGAGVTVRTVTWSSSDATVATVDATGKVTGVKTGVVSIVAKATADPNVSGAAAVTVGAGAQAPTVTISSVNNTTCGLNGCSSTPVPVSGAQGQLDVILNVEANGQVLRSVQATLKCGNDSITKSQTLSDLAPVSAEAASSPVTISIPTAEFNPTTGVPTIHNNSACTISASATTAGGVQSATNSQPIALNNPDAVIVNSTFSGGQSATDANGIAWKSGSLTVAVLPILYNIRTLATMTVSLPAAQGQNRFLTLPAAATGATSASFPNATSGGTASARIGQLTLTGIASGANGPILDVNGFPVPLTPIVLAIDSNGNDVNLIPTASTSSFRLDNQSPLAPTVAQIPLRQAGWVSGGTAGPPVTPAYVFTGVGAGTVANPNTQTVNYQSGGDIGTAGTVGVGGTASTTTGLSAGTTATYFFKLASAYVTATDGLTGGTDVGNAGSAGNCTTTTTGWTAIASAADLPPTSTALIYVVRILETDKLGNFRCTDLGSPIGGAFVLAKFGVDKLSPVAVYVEPSANPTAAGDKMVINATTVPNTTPFFTIGLSDDAAGFNATPLQAMIIRLAIDPSTGVASTPNSAFGCVVPSTISSGVCTAQNASTTTSADGASNIDGYYTYTAIARDQARNATTLAPRQILIDRTIPTMGSIAVPATINPGPVPAVGAPFLPSSPGAQFSTSAADNLDLLNYDYSLTYVTTPSGGAGNFVIRSPATATTQTLGVAFDNTLTNTSAFSLSVSTFIRTLAVTNAAGTPAATSVLPTSIAARSYDAALNASLVNPGTGAGSSGIPTASVNVTNRTDFTVAPAGQNAGATMTAFVESNAAASISNCPAAGCAGGAAPANATTITQFTATVAGNEGTNFQFTNPFSQVQFYYFDNVTSEYILIGSAIAPVVTDNTTATLRTFTFTLNTTFDPPATITSPLKLVAVGVNASGDALASPVNTAITLTNP